MAYSVSPVVAPSALPTNRPVPRSATESLSSTLVESSDDHPHAESVASSSTSTDSDSGSESDSDSDDDDDDSDAGTSDEEQDRDESQLMLERLLVKAKQSAHARRVEQDNAKKSVKPGQEGDTLAGNDEVVLFGEDDDETSDDDDDDDDEADQGTPRASTSKSVSLPPSLVRPLSVPSFSSTRPLAPSSTPSTLSLLKGKARAGPISLAQDLGGALVATSNPNARKGVHVVDGEGNGRGEKWGMAPQPRLSKNQLRANKPHTAGSQWFDMPATPMTPELKRELDALRLRNALDPKKFMKGGAKKDKVGEFFQIGHVITPSTRASNATSQPSVSKRSFVEELVEDEQARAYAKRKTKEVMQKGMSGRKRQRKGGKGAYAMGVGGRDGKGEAGAKRRKR
ncbi:hypothetical protein JCM10212_000936 [Sporobolomyces blumeae]